jgi:hypothetical protein
MSTKRSPSEPLTLVRDLLLGTAKHFSTASSLVFGGATYTVASLTALLQSYVDLVNAVSVARAAYQGQLDRNACDDEALGLGRRRRRRRARVKVAGEPGKRGG